MSGIDSKLYAVQQAGFALYDAMLFLDTHPEDNEAKTYFKARLEDYEKASKEYEAVFGPLLMYSQNGKDVISWVDSPLPWEAE